jgi:hypothetical protein
MPPASYNLFLKILSQFYWDFLIIVVNYVDCSQMVLPSLNPKTKIAFGVF